MLETATERALPCYSGWMATDQIWWVSNEDNCFYQLFFCFKAGLVNIKLCLLPLKKNCPEFGTNWRDLSNCDCNRTTSDYHFIFKSYSDMKYKMLSFSLVFSLIWHEKDKLHTKPKLVQNYPKNTNLCYGFTSKRNSGQRNCRISVIHKIYFASRLRDGLLEKKR